MEGGGAQQSGAGYRKQSSRPVNKGSHLLSDSENELLFRLIGEKNYTLSSGVAQFLTANLNPPRFWKKKCAGAVCLVKDYQKRAYFLRVFDLQKNSMLWEQMLYDNFTVKAPCSVLLTFEGDDYVCGLNFSSAEEANIFRNQLDKKYDNEQKQKRKTQAVSRLGGPPLSQEYNNTNSTYGHISGANKESKNGKKITKDQIGPPKNFVHKAHFDWNPEERFETSGTDGDDFDSTVAELVRKIGYKSENMSKSVRRLVYDVIQAQGGIEVAREEVKRMRVAPPQFASRSIPKQLPLKPPHANSHPRNNEHQQQQPPPRVPVRSAPPPPLPKHPALASGKSQASSGTHRISQPPPPTPVRPPPQVIRTHLPAGQSFGLQIPVQQSGVPRSANAPALPLPPPGAKPVGKGPPPPPPPKPPGDLLASPPKIAVPAPQAGRGDLLAEIRRGAALKRVQKDWYSVSSSSSAVDGKTTPNNTIEQDVEQREETKTTPLENMDGIAGALARALADRRNQIHESDDEDILDEYIEEEEDDWDD